MPPLANPIIEAVKPASDHAKLVLDELERLVTRQLVLVGDDDLQVISDAFSKDNVNDGAGTPALSPAPVDQTGFLLGRIRLS